MEKLTKKKKRKSKRLKRRIGLIAVGGLSLVLTVCLSVGATLAWFAGSTWASNDLYMGGPVYVEMAGRGHAGKTTGDIGETPDDGTDLAEWRGGDGRLDIVASDRSTGTATDPAGKQNHKNILLPGQKLLIYSQARVFSTAEWDNESDGAYNNNSSGANTTNSAGNTVKYTDSSGRVKTTTTSVLRAKFSINVEFDPTSGFNNFTDPAYANGYPTKSGAYTCAHIGTSVSTDWDKALVTETNKVTFKTINDGTAYSYEGRRDAVANADGKFVAGADNNELLAIKAGTNTSIYKWTYVSQDTYLDAAKDVATNIAAQAGSKKKYVRMGAPFDGTINTFGTASNTKWKDASTKVAYETNSAGSGNGFYGVWICDTTTGKQTESDSFYKARCDAYLKSYVEHYEDEYNRDLVLKIQDQLSGLETALNSSFTGLVNESSDRILQGFVGGFQADGDGSVTYPVNAQGKPLNHAGTAINAIGASWLYIDPKIGNDTNASDSSSSVGGWWYLVESDTALVSATTNANLITTTRDSFSTTKASSTAKANYNATTGVFEGYTWDNDDTALKNNPIKSTDTSATIEGFRRDSNTATNKASLNAKLYEITPSATASGVVAEAVGTGGTSKVVSVSFPFVNGNFELPGKELTNLFANAKISFQITFQALQAFFPFAPSIDGLKAGSALAGTGKALNIQNAIPIYNEAFDYLSYLNTSTR